MRKRTLTLPHFTVSFGYESIIIKVYESELKEKRGTVTGFQFGFHTEIRFSFIDLKEERAFARWLRENFPSIFQSKLNKNIQSEYPLNKWFPYMESYDVKVNLSVERVPSLTAEIDTWIKVNFSKGVTYKRFDKDIRRFISEAFHLQRFPLSLVDETAEYVVVFESPFEFFLTTETKTFPTIQTFSGEGRTDFNFPNIFTIEIRLREPPPENIVQSLLNSSSEDEFIFKLSMLIDQDVVEEIHTIPSHLPTQSIRDMKTIQEVIEFLRETIGEG